MEKADTSIFRWKSRHVDFSLEKPTRRFSVEKADTSIFCWKSGHVGPEIFFSIKKDQFDKCIIEETISENTLNKVQSEPDDCPVSMDLNSNNGNLNSGPKCALFQLKSTCPLFQRKIDVSAFPAENRRVGYFHQADEFKGPRILFNTSKVTVTIDIIVQYYTKRLFSTILRDF